MLLAPKRVFPASTRQAPGHIPALDGIRGAAAATVFIYHYGGGARSSQSVVRFIGETIHLGWAGVSLFFVLSGFLITGILLDSMERPNWRSRFYVRRTLRIFPLYYFAIVAVILVNVLFGRSWRSILPIWPFFLSLQDFPQLVHYGVLGPLFNLGHLWSLAVEEQFYLIWPLILLSASRRGRVRQLCFGVFLGSLLFRGCIFGLNLNSEWALYFIGGRSGEMAAGAFLAAIFRAAPSERDRLTLTARPVLVASGASLFILILSTGETDARGAWLGILGVALFSVFFAALIALSLQPGIAQRVFSLPFLRWLGKISYGIYIYHLLLYPVFTWLTHRLLPELTGTGYQLMLAAIATMGTLSVASLSFTTLESGFLQLKDSLSRSHHAS